MSARATRAPRRIAIGPAVALSAAVVAWEQLWHSARGVAAPTALIPHLATDTALAFPLAYLAFVCAVQVSSKSWLRALIAASVFTVALIPSVGVHDMVHGWYDHQPGLSPLAIHSGHQHLGEPSSPLSHGVSDALAGLPVALLAAFVASSGRVRVRLARRQAALFLAAATVFSVLPQNAQAGPTITPFATPLPIPEVLTGQHITLTASVTQQQILPGNTTTMWTYNGSFPGPTIRRPTGQPTDVTVVNDLEPWMGSITLHHHGNHSESVDDGQPADHLIPPGGSRTYTYPLVENGAPERGAMQWYHDHMMDATARNNWMGMNGMFILDDPAEASINAQLPNGARDVPLEIVDRSFDDDNQIPYNFSAEGVLGNAILVNGAPQPYFDVADVRYRLRILNASNTRSYDFTLSDGRPMIQVATESGLLPTPISRTHIELGPAERAEVIVDFSGEEGQNVVLRNTLAAPVQTNLTQVMQFRVVRHEADASVIPATLRPAPVFGALPLGATRVFTFGRDPVSGEWTINGKGFDPNRVDAHPRLGSVERWIFVNTSDVDHIVHIHDVDWQIVSRVNPDTDAVDGVLGEPGLHESFRLRPNEIVTIESRFTDHLGVYVFHCHILEHEDYAMMDQFEVVR